MSRITSENTFKTAIIQPRLENGGYTGGCATHINAKITKTKKIIVLQKEDLSKRDKHLIKSVIAKVAYSLFIDKQQEEIGEEQE